MKGKRTENEWEKKLNKQIKSKGKKLEKEKRKRPTISADWIARLDEKKRKGGVGEKMTDKGWA